MRIIIHGAIEKLHVTPVLREFLNHEHLMDIVAGQAIGRREEDALKDCQGRLVPKPIQARAVELGPTIAIITVDMGFIQMPVRLSGDIVPQAGKLLFNRLLLLLPAG